MSRTKLANLSLRELKAIAKFHGMYVYKKRDGRVIVNYHDKERNYWAFLKGTPLEDIATFIRKKAQEFYRLGHDDAFSLGCPQSPQSEYLKGWNAGCAAAKQDSHESLDAVTEQRNSCLSPGIAPKS